MGGTPAPKQPDATVQATEIGADPEKAFEYVIAAFGPEAWRRIEQYRALLKIEKRHSVFFMLAIATELLQRMEAARDVLHAPFEALREDVLALEEELHSRLDALNRARAVELQTIQAAAARAAIPLVDAATQVTAACDSVAAATLTLRSAHNAVSQIDDDLRAEIGRSVSVAVVDAVRLQAARAIELELRRQRRPGAVHAEHLAYAVAGVAVFVAGFVANVAWLHALHR